MGSVVRSHRCTSIAVVLCASLAAACGGTSPSPTQTATTSRKGVYGSYYYVTVIRPAGGTITSGDGAIRCGADGNLCGDELGQTRYAWSESVTLTEAPDAAHGYVFQGWAGDCSGTSPTCTLAAGADKTVVAIFDVPGSVPPSDGHYGMTFLVTVARPSGGMVSSTDGQIRCGTTGTACTGSFPWTSQATLLATPDAGNTFGTWAGDCNGTGPCVLDTSTSGADKTIAAVFGANGVVQHGYFFSPAVHGAAFFDLLNRRPGYFDCASTLCHGPTYAGLGIAPSCNGCHEHAGWTGWRTNCSFCHGARSASAKAGYIFAMHPAWSAPPDDIAGRLAGTSSAARTGAHQAHLVGATAGGLSFASPFRCGTCHPVPIDLSHIDGSSGARAQVVLAGAGQGGLPASLGAYDPATGTCATYCHGMGASPAWGSTGLQCGACHGVPPSAATGHPSISSDLTGCSGCHPDTMNVDGTLNVAGGKHVDGIVEAAGGHGDYTSVAVHAPRFFEYISGQPGALACSACHGADYSAPIVPGGQSCNSCHAAAGWTGWRTNCSFCHGAKTASAKAGYAFSSHPLWAAPPDDLAGRLNGANELARTGAHQAHLTGVMTGGVSLAPAFPCATCHPVPSDLSHISGAAAEANVTLSGAGTGVAGLPAALGTYDPAAGTCATYCHGQTLAGGANTTPRWATVDGTQAGCGTCHGTPPPESSGHPPVSSALTGCATCHPDTVNPDGTLNAAGGKHIDGVIEAAGGHGNYASVAVHAPRFFDYVSGQPGALDCTLCHGADYSAPIVSGQSCNSCHAAAGWVGWRTNCSFCHGAKTASAQAGYVFSSHPLWAAPPDDLAGRLNGANELARTGAHQAHLTGVMTGGVSLAPAFPCATCHPVPSDLSHISGAAAEATVTLSGAGTGVAGLPANLGTYDPAAGTCATYCHGQTLAGGGNTTPRWATVDGTQAGCGTCHGVPPPGSSGHPVVPSNLTGCAACHPDTVNPDGTLNFAGGKHVDGVVEASGGHGDYSSVSVHAPKFFEYVSGKPGALDCTLCHGADYSAPIVSGQSCNSCHAAAGWAGWRTNCSFCHGARTASAKAGYVFSSHPQWAAPPDDLGGRLNGANQPARTGAHQVHLAGIASDGFWYSRPFQCATCHPVPSDLSHISGSPARAAVTLSGAGTGLPGMPANLGSYDPATGSCATYCHGASMKTSAGGTPASPLWSGTTPACSNGCHGHPPASGRISSGATLHEDHVYRGALSCFECHSDTIDWAGPLLVGGPHVNGVKDVVFNEDPSDTWNAVSGSCNTGCHGGTRQWR